MRYSIEPGKFDKIFGPRDPMDDTGAGRTRRCKVTGQWLKPGQSTHNLPRATGKRNWNLAAPQIAPSFGDAVKVQDAIVDPATGEKVCEEVILTSANDKREYMARNELVEYDEGVTNGDTWVTEKEEDQQVIENIKMFADTDTEADVWDTYHENNAEVAGDLLTENTDVDAQEVEVIE